MKFTLLLFFLSFALISCDRTDEAFSQSADADGDADTVTEVISIEEWKVPWDDTRTRDPFAAPDGKVFFAGQRADYIGFFDPETEEFGYHELNEGAGPHTVVVADDGTVWYAGNRDRHIGKMNAESGEITRYEMDNDYVRDPHTFAFDNDGNIWFTAQGGNGVGHFNITTGETEVVPALTPNSRPYGIRMDRTGERAWIALLGTNKIATINPETMEMEEVELPREDTRVRRLDITSDGNVWYGDFNSGYIGRYNPAPERLPNGKCLMGKIPDPMQFLQTIKIASGYLQVDWNRQN